MYGIIFILSYSVIMMIPAGIITYAIVQKKIAKSNDVGTKVKLIEFSTDESDSKFYCKTEIDPGMIIARNGLKRARTQEETEDD